MDFTIDDDSLVDAIPDGADIVAIRDSQIAALRSGKYLRYPGKT